MKETKYLPRWKVRAFYAIAALAILLALPLGVQYNWIGFILELIVLVVFSVLRFVWFHCPHCGRVLRILPKMGAEEALEVTYCPECGGPYACK